MLLNQQHRRVEKEPVYLDDEEQKLLLALVAGKPRDEALITLMMYRGLRASEPGLLRIEDYSERSRRLYVRRLKGSISQEYHLADREVRAIRRWLRMRGQPRRVALSWIREPGDLEAPSVPDLQRLRRGRGVPSPQAPSSRSEAHLRHHATRQRRRDPRCPGSPRPRSHLEHADLCSGDAGATRADPRDSSTRPLVFRFPSIASAASWPAGAAVFPHSELSPRSPSRTIADTADTSFGSGAGRRGELFSYSKGVERRKSE